MALSDMKKYSNKQLGLFFIAAGIVLGTILFWFSVTPMVIFFIIILLLCFTYIKYLWFWFILFLGSLPFNSFLAIDIGVPLRLSYLLFMVVLLSIMHTIYQSVISGEQERKDIFERFKTPFDREILFVLLIIVFSIFQSQYILSNSPVTGDTMFNYPWIKSITKFLLLGLLFTIFYCTVFIVNTKEKLRRILFWCALFVFIYSVYGIVSYLFFLGGVHVSFFGFESIIQHDPSADLPRIRSVAEEPLFFGFYVITSILTIITLWFYQFMKWKTDIFSYNLSFQIVIIIVALYLSFSRSAWLGFLFGGAWLLLFCLGKLGKEKTIHALSVAYNYLLFRYNYLLKLQRPKSVAFFCLLIVLGIGLYYIISTYIITPLVIEQVTDTFNPGGSKFWSTKTRLITYEQAVNAFLQHPILGIGYENFNFYSGNKYYDRLVNYNFNWTEVNNYPLKVLAELGIIGFICVAFLYIKIIVITLKSIKETTDLFLQAVLVGCFATLIAISVILLFSSSIIMPYLWVLAGIHVATIKLNVSRKNEKEIGIQK